MSWDDFSAKASDAEIAGFVRAIGKVARDGEMVVQGYRLLANTGKRSGQEVAHLHVHIFGGAAAWADACVKVSRANRSHKGLRTPFEPLGSAANDRYTPRGI